MVQNLFALAMLAFGAVSPGVGTAQERLVVEIGSGAVEGGGIY